MIVSDDNTADDPDRIGLADQEEVAEADESVLMMVASDDVRAATDRAQLRQDGLDQAAIASDLRRQTQQVQPSYTIPRSSVARGGVSSRGAASGRGGPASQTAQSGDASAARSSEGVRTRQSIATSKEKEADVSVSVSPKKKKRKLKKSAEVLAAPAIPVVPTSKLFPRSMWPEGFTEVMMDGHTKESFTEVMKAQNAGGNKLEGKKARLPGKHHYLKIMVFSFSGF